MFVMKNKYFLIIESIKDIDLKKIKKRNKFSIVYRNHSNTELITNLIKFRKECKLRSIDFYVANNYDLAVYLSADGIYLSAFNKTFRGLSLKNKKFNIIGSAHTQREIYTKVQQGCSAIFFSKLFLVSYDKESPFLGVIKFNNFLKISKLLIPLGGINLYNLNSLKMVKSYGFALMSEIKKKPAKILSRLF